MLSHLRLLLPEQVRDACRRALTTMECVNHPRAPSLNAPLPPDVAKPPQPVLTDVGLTDADDSTREDTVVVASHHKLSENHRSDDVSNKTDDVTQQPQVTQNDLITESDEGASKQLLQESAAESDSGTALTAACESNSDVEGDTSVSVKAFSIDNQVVENMAAKNAESGAAAAVAVAEAAVDDVTAGSTTSNFGKPQYDVIKSFYIACTVSSYF